MTRTFIPRKSAPKSRGGCFTCKVRRIKCDEIRPHCVKCTSTGRKCDGYGSRSPPAISPDPGLTALSTSAFPSGTPEARSFDFFRTCTLPNLSLYFGSPGWTRLALQASCSEPAIQHAVAALGALHEHLENSNKLGHKSIPQNDNGLEYAAQEFTQALIFLSALLAKSDNRSIELALIGALICMYYEALQENFETAQVHLENCLLVLQSILPSEKNWLSTKNIKMQIDNDIIQAFAQLDIDTSCTIGRRSPSLCIAATPINIPTPFSSITQARQLLYALSSQLHSFMRSTADAYKTDLTAIPLPTIAECNFLQAQLKEWEVSFSAFLSHPTTKLTRQEQQGANILSIQNKVAYMKAANCLYADEMIFDDFNREFEEILCLADYLIYLSNGTGDGRGSQRKKVVLMFEMGIIEGLFWTAIKCRKHSIRRRAVDVMRKVTWQEGVWNSEMMAAIAEKYIEMEEEGMEGTDAADARCGIDGGETRVPEWLRLHDHGWEMNLKSRRIEVRAGRRENGVDGEWTWVRGHAVW